MRILVTGSEGFIGSNLTKLDSDVMFETLDKKGDPDHLIDLTRVNWDDFKLAKFQAVIHLAAEISVEESFQRREHYWETNVVATKNLFEACALASVPRIIFASSAAVYGPSGEPVKYVQHKPQPQSPYAETKVRGEEIGNLVSNEQTKVTSFRFFNVLGPGQSPDSSYAAVIPIFVDRLCKGEDIEIHGNGTQTRDFVNVKDVSRALINAAKTSPKSNNEVINLGTGSGITVLELAHLISKIVEEEGGPSTSQILFGPQRKGDVRLSVSNNSGLEKYLDTANMTDLAAGIRELVRINLH